MNLVNIIPEINMRLPLYKMMLVKFRPSNMIIQLRENILKEKLKDETLLIDVMVLEVYMYRTS